MCGISGEIRFDGAPASTRAVQAMTDALAPRGPDAGGLLAHGRVALGHRRLKVIDLSERGRQPMEDPELGLDLVFNGCIYNHRELRHVLEARGYRFFSSSDTEVVLKAWHAWGADCVERFNGMFAFAIAERATGRVALARDRLGIKPLYLAEGDGGRRVRFASSLPALLAAGDVDTAIDPLALNHYMSFHSVVPAPRTVLAGVRKLPPATVAVLERDGRRIDSSYWRLRFEPSREDAARSAGEWTGQVRDHLRRAVARRAVADVPVGVLLSGGLDSSLVVAGLRDAGAAEIDTFSIGFEAHHGEAGDEFEYSDLVARHFGTRHHRIEVASRRLLDALPRAVGAMSEPMVSHDCTAFALLSEEVSEHVRVVQSGQGADEVFGGYHWYPPLLGSNDAARDYLRHFADRDDDEMREALGEGLHVPGAADDFVRGAFARPGAARGIDRALRLDTTVMLVEDPVKRVDNMTMASGLEARVPFLDHELVELAARVPAELKLAQGGKGILKDAARGLVPDAVIDRPKGYFPVPALKYLEGPYLEFTRDHLASRAARERGLFAPAHVDALLEDPAAHITPLGGSKLWQLGLLEAWLQRHVA